MATKRVKRVEPAEPKEDLVWIELEKPRDAAHAEAICDKVNRMLRRLATPEDAKRGLRGFFWSTRHSCYCYGDGMGYLDLADRGHWFKLDYLGRE